MFIDRDNKFLKSDFPPIVNATFVTADKEEKIFTDIELFYVTDTHRAQRLAVLVNQRGRQGLVAEFPANLTALEVAVGDVIDVTNDILGWTDKEFEVLSWTLAEEGGVDLVLQETASGIYSFDPETDEQVLDIAPNTNLPGAFDAPPVPTGLALASGESQLLLQGDGTILSRILATWTVVPEIGVTSGGIIEIQMKQSAKSIFEDMPIAIGDAVQAFLSPVRDGIAYDVRIRSVNRLLVPSAYATVSNHTVVGKSAVPDDVTAFSAAQNGIVVNFRWDQVGNVDLAGYEIRYNPNPLPRPFDGPDWLLGTTLTEVTRGTAITSAQVPPGDWTFMIKAFDTSGNESSIAGTASVIVVADGFDVILQSEQSPGWDRIQVKLTQNLQLWSEEADNAVWTKVNSTITVNDEVAPNDTNTADKLVENSSTGLHTLERSHTVISTNDDYSLSGFFKADERKWIGLFFKLLDLSIKGAYFNVDDGTIGTVDAGVTARVKAVGNGFFRCAVTIDIGSGGPTSLPTEYRLARDDNDDNYTGDGASGLHVWGMQFEKDRSRASSYTKTTTVALPRTTPTFVLHYTGVLVPDSQNLASDNGFETFDKFVVNPEPICIYTAAEFDLTFDDTVRVWADIISALGPGETTGIANPEMQIDYQLDTGLLDIYETWTIGNVKARYITHRIVLDTSKGIAKITGFKPTVDLAERSEGAKSVVIGASGLAITYDKRFHVAPRVTVTVDATSALIGTKESVTTTGFTAHVFNTGGAEVGGTIDWTAEGA